MLRSRSSGARAWRSQATGRRARVFRCRVGQSTAGASRRVVPVAARVWPRQAGGLLVGAVQFPMRHVDRAGAISPACSERSRGDLVRARGRELDGFRQRPIGRCRRQRGMAGRCRQYGRPRVPAIVLRIRRALVEQQRRRFEQQRRIVRRRRWRRLVGPDGVRRGLDLTWPERERVDLPLYVPVHENPPPGFDTDLHVVCDRARRCGRQQAVTQERLAPNALPAAPVRSARCASRPRCSRPG